MEGFIFCKLREKGKENGIDIFNFEGTCNRKFIVHYFLDKESNEKTIEVDFMDSIDNVIAKIKLQNPKKPPLGIKPHFIWIEQRIDEIKEAINRRIEVKENIPHEWYIELAQLENERIANTTHLEIKVPEGSNMCQEIARKNFCDCFDKRGRNIYK